MTSTTPRRPRNAVEVEREQEQAPRVARKPFGARTQKLSYPTREGYHRHWFNDVGDRVVRAKEAGYSHVDGHDGKPVSRVTGSLRDGSPQHSFLMEIREEWYREDQAALQAQVDEVDRSIKMGAFKQQAGDNRYIPSTGIHYDPRGGR